MDVLHGRFGYGVFGGDSSAHFYGFVGVEIVGVDGAKVFVIH